MSNRQLDRMLEHEHYVNETACCDCGYHRSGGHHPKIRCPKSGRCGSCGNDWPCADHAPRGSLTAKSLQGRRVRLRYTIESRAGVKIEKGEIMKVDGWWRRTVHLIDVNGKTRYIRRVELDAVELAPLEAADVLDMRATFDRDAGGDR